MSLSYVDLSVDGTPQLLVLNNGVPYGIQNAQGFTAFGGGGPSGPAIKASNGTSLVAGDIVEAGAATSGTPGSGSYILGVAALDSAGNLVGNWIPRTGTLASLQALALAAGEIASATDVPAIVQGTGTAGVNFTTYPFGSATSFSVGGSGAITAALPITSDIVRLTIGAGITSFTGTLANGYIDGQELTVELVSSPVGMNTYVVGGITISSIYIVTANRTPGTALIAKFKWLSTSTAWALCEPGVYTQKSLTGSPSGLIWGTDSVTKLGGVVFGHQTTAGVGAASFGNGGSAAGDNSLIFLTGTASGAQSMASYGAGSYADQGLALQPGAAVYGFAGVCVGQATVYAPYGGALLPAGNGPSVFGFGSYSVGGASIGNVLQSFNYTSVNNAGFPGSVVFTGTSGWTGSGLTALEPGQFVTVPLGYYNGQVLYGWGTVTAVTATTCTVNVSNPSGNANPAPTGCTATGVIYACSDGIQAGGFGLGALPHNFGEIAFSPSFFAAAGDAQYAIVKLGIQTTSATPAILTTNFAAVNTNKTPGNSNRLIVQPGQSLGGTLTITLKQNASGNSATFIYALLATNNGGTIGVATSLIKAIGLGTTQWTTTWTAAPPFSIAGNNTYQSVDVTFTGLASTAINASATFVPDSTTTAA